MKLYWQNSNQPLPRAGYEREVIDYKEKEKAEHGYN
jgi:hypothetical protein